VHHRIYSNVGVIPHYVINNIPLEEVKEIKDPGACFELMLVFDKHI